MTLFQSVALGVTQGLTEFLPVSSSGHLALGERLLKTQMEQPLAFEVLLHAATLLATVMVFWRELLDLIRYVVQQAPRAIARQGWSAGVWRNPRGRMVCAVVVITLVTAPFGVLFEEQIEQMAGSMTGLGLGWLLTAAWLIAAHWARERYPDAGAIPLWVMVVLGLAQASALIPSVSRSGMTIATALLCGVDRRTSGELSFIASIPAIAGASILMIPKINMAEVSAATASAGFVASLIAGWVALVVLLRFVRQGRLWIFAPYCIILGLYALLQ